MIRHLKQIIAALALLAFSIISISDSFGQGISRSNGIGIRASYWNLSGQPTRVSITSTERIFNVNGVGGWLTFFSRLDNKWLMDLSLGSVARVTGSESDFDGTDADVSLLVPLLFGVRYDVLSTKLHSRFQPYLMAGVGPYWATTFRVVERSTGEEFTGEGRMMAGGYAGAGMNLALSSWLALTFDLKYHFVDIEISKNLRSWNYGDEFSGFEFGIGFAFMWGSKREMFRVKGTKLLVKDLYPTYYQFYNSYPLALVTVENTAGYPIEVNAQSYIRGYSEQPLDSDFIRLEKDEIKDIPVTALFGTKLKRVDKRTPAVLDIKLEARAGSRSQKHVSTQIMVHHRNAWNGDMDKLVFFVTPDHESILQLGRRLTQQVVDGTNSVPATIAVARAAFDTLADMRIRYHSDPNVTFYQDDRVQFAFETLEIRAGDCDDLVVLCSSLLEGMGIKTAFVEVQDPEQEIAHVYLMFDSGMPASASHQISSNPKRYVLREKDNGERTAWIPIETTLIERGFDASWQSGALQYLQDAVYRGGLAAGWVKIIDVN